MFKDVAIINAYGHSKRSLLLAAELNKLKGNYDIVIAHNLAALYPAYIFAKRQKIPFAFDVEDYHPGEIVRDGSRNEVFRRRFLLRKFLPLAKYISYASNLIGEHILADLYPNQVDHHFLIPNCFPESEFASPLALVQPGKLRLVWFSQYITSNRGLEELIEALKAFNGQFELHLIGTLKEHFKTEIEKYKDFIFMYKAMKQVDLHRFISKFDVGLALEMSSVDLNKDIAVSNKIYAYAQAGLYILATNTKGQTGFVKQYPWSGEVVGQSTSHLVSALANLFRNRVAIRSGAADRYQKALLLSWVKESQKLVEAWK
ncbi:hypothetical protein ACSX1A_07575 [Pontibacter sp. MBLB2868]|uniref:hypothetical protein n=1 Tax=Pontibacter sp. MBLB2868 TaxID=3451555 RepID=UPI003F750299